MNEIVKYSNELHEMSFSSLTETQQNVFFTLLQQFRNTNGYTLELDYNKLYELADIPRNTDFRHEVLNQLSKLQDFKFRYESNNRGNLRQDVIFPSLEIDPNEKKLFVKVSEGFKDRYINSPLKGWTRYELAEFVWLNGTYTKTIYRYLKQFRTQGRWRIGYKDFKRFLGIPESYKSCDIDKQILKPALKALSEPRNIFETTRTPFENLSVIKHKKGREIESLEFVFIPQSPDMLEKDIEQHKRSLTTISNNIKKRERITRIKNKDKQIVENQEQKINHFTGRKINWCDAYIDIHFYSDNKLENCFDTCKILDLYEHDNNVVMTAKNQENLSTFQIKFENRNHFENWLNTVK